MAGRTVSRSPVTVFTTGTSENIIAKVSAGANEDVEINEITISFLGVTSTDPKVTIRFIRGATEGAAFDEAALALNNWDEQDDGAAASTISGANTTAVSRTGGTILYVIAIQPVSGFTWRGTYRIKKSSALQISCTTATSVTGRITIIGKV